MRNGLIFVLTNQNRNSVAALAGALDVAEGLGDLRISMLWDQEGLVGRIAQAARELDRVVIAFSFATASASAVFQRVAELRDALGQAHARVLMVAGGPHATGDSEGSLVQGIDIAVRGEGEETLPALLRAWLGGAPLDDVPGLAFRRGGDLLMTRPAPPVDIESYPPHSIKHGRWGFIEISRGCPWTCRYCQTSFSMGARMRHRSVSHIAEAIREAMAVGYSYARFITPNAFAYGAPDGRQVNLAAIEDLLRTVSDLVGRERTYLGTFPSEVRPESVSPEAVALVRRYAANKTLLLGAQSGSEEMLRRMHRGHGVEEIRRAADAILAGGLKPTVDFIFGLPGETDHDRGKTVALMRELTAAGAVIHSHMFMPLPGTPWESELPGAMSLELESLLGELGRKGQHSGRVGRQARLARQMRRR